MTSERRLWLNSVKILTVSCWVLTVVTGMFGWPPDRSLPNTIVCPRCGAAPCRRCCSPASLQRAARVQSGVTSMVPPCLLPQVSLSFSFHHLLFPTVELLDSSSFLGFSFCIRFNRLFPYCFSSMVWVASVSKMSSLKVTGKNLSLFTHTSGAWFLRLVWCHPSSVFTHTNDRFSVSVHLFLNDVSFYQSGSIASLSLSVGYIKGEKQRLILSLSHSSTLFSRFLSPSLTHTLSL